MFHDLSFVYLQPSGHLWRIKSDSVLFLFKITPRKLPRPLPTNTLLMPRLSQEIDTSFLGIISKLEALRNRMKSQLFVRSYMIHDDDSDEDSSDETNQSDSQSATTVPSKWPVPLPQFNNFTKEEVRNEKKFSPGTFYYPYKCIPTETSYEEIRLGLRITDNDKWKKLMVVSCNIACLL
jgi:hypothetical protein